MSEVYIRSQNKEKLYRLGGNYACVEYGEYEDIKKKRVTNIGARGACDLVRTLQAQSSTEYWQGLRKG